MTDTKRLADDLRGLIAYPWLTKLSREIVSEAADLIARMPEMEADARRYRWLRDSALGWEWPGINARVGENCLPTFNSNLRLKVWTGLDTAIEFHGNSLDLQIDNAIKWELAASSTGDAWEAGK